MWTPSGLYPGGAAPRNSVGVRGAVGSRRLTVGVDGVVGGGRPCSSASHCSRGWGRWGQVSQRGQQSESLGIPCWQDHVGFCGVCTSGQAVSWRCWVGDFINQACAPWPAPRPTSSLQVQRCTRNGALCLPVPGGMCRGEACGTVCCLGRGVRAEAQGTLSRGLWVAHQGRAALHALRAGLLS